MRGRAAATLAAALLASGCDGSSGGYAGGAYGGHPGDGGRDAADGGPRDGGLIDAQPDGGFLPVLPCAEPGAYVDMAAGAAPTVRFGGTIGYVYAPACLKVPAGATVTFAGDFAPHPLAPSAVRGTDGNPIGNVSAGSTASFTFAGPGFFAYFCPFHGTLDDGTGMAGVIWVQ